MRQVVVGRQLAASMLHVALFVIAVLAATRPAASDELKEADAAAINKVRIGIANHFKVARWAAIQVRVDSSLAPSDARVSVATLDNDGTPTVASAPLPESVMPDAGRVGTVYTNVGRMGAPIDVSIVESNMIVETRQPMGRAAAAQPGLVELPATAELLLFLGPVPPRVLDGQASRNLENGELIRKAVRVESSSELPDNWLGYDAVDLAVLIIGDGGPFDEFARRFAADEQRLAAFIRWIELGGRLVIFCGGENVEKLLGESRPLAVLLPGKLADVVNLPETGRLEHFAGTESPIGAREAMRVPRLVDVDGTIELYGGRQASALPLVVRSPRGLGEIAFVGVDPFRPPLANWSGQKAFVNAVMRPYLAADPSASGSQKLVTRGYNDLSGALRQRLGRTFAGVAPIAFSLVTVLAIGYLLVLGPLDYYITQRWLKRSWVAWITFPLIVILFGGMALGLAQRRDGSGLRVNQLELVDVDTIAGQARGTVWSAVYSPAASALDLRLAVELFSGGTGRAEVRLHSWALPGSGIGGTQSGRKVLGADAAYRYGEHGDVLFGVPILQSGTKSLLGRWTAPAGSLMLAELANEDGLVTGSLVNRSGRTLRNARLYFGEWGYRLGTLANGARIVVGEEFRPRSFKTIVTQDSLGVTDRGHSGEQVFIAERASLKEILNVMMFYEAVGGFGFAQLQNRLQAYCDLSRMPMLGRAVLVADVETAGSRLVDPETGIAIGDADSAGIVYRFVLPVRTSQ